MMKKFCYDLRFLSAGFFAFVLVGCGLSQSPPGNGFGEAAYRQNERLVGEQSRVKGETPAQDLVYMTASGRGDVYVFTYPGGKRVQALSGLLEPQWECSDLSGNVFITAWADASFSSSVIYEYSHGGTTPIATLSDPGKASGCAIDSVTGDLAVSNSSDSTNPYGSGYGDVAVYAGAGGTPTMFYSSKFNFGSCGYDASGNLYTLSSSSADVDQLIRLAAGSSTFVAILVNKQIHSSPLTQPSVQWDGTHMTVSSAAYPQGRKGAGNVSVYRLKISGSSASVIGTTKLVSRGSNRHAGQIWIQGNSVIGFSSYKGFWNATFWPYPAGGKAPFNIKKILATNQGFLAGVTVSVAPSR